MAAGIRDRPKPYTDLPENQTSPEPELEKRTRRRFSAAYKLKTLAPADACEHGEQGMLLRREPATGHVENLGKSALGPVIRKTSEQHRLEQLEKETARLQRCLSIAEDGIELQKKSSTLDHANSGSSA